MVDNVGGGLQRSGRDRMLFGVCGGLGDYFFIDPVFIRLAFVLLAFSGPGVLAYLAFAAVMPPARRQVGQRASRGELGSGADLREVALQAWPTLPASPAERRARRWQRIGSVLILLGTLVLAANLNLLVWIRWELVWPLVIIAIGTALIVRHARR